MKNNGLNCAMNVEDLQWIGLVLFVMAHVETLGREILVW